MTTPILGLDELATDVGGKELTHNKALRYLEALFTRALAVANTPASSNDGDVFIVGDTPAGDFAAFSEHDVALRYSSTWVAITPSVGVRLWVVDPGVQRTFTGSTWETAGGLSNIVDDTTPQLGGNLDLNGKGITQILTAGENLVDGDWCYLKSDSKMWKTDASAEATAAGKICVCTDTIAADAAGVFLKRGIYTTSGLTAASTYYLSETAGAITLTKPTTADAIVRVVGYADSTTLLDVDIDQTYIEV
jgi:hypothetical protein